MIFQTEMKGGNQKDSSDESRGTPFGARSSNRACYSPGIPPVRFPTEAAGEQHGKCTCRAGRFDSSNSTSIGNLNQVNQTLSGGSSGSIGTTAQDSLGNQGSSAQTDTKIGNKVNVLESLTGGQGGPH